MSDRANWEPGADGSMSLGDFHKAVTDAYLTAMRSHYEEVTPENAKLLKQLVAVPEQSATMVEMYKTVRAVQLNAIEAVERQRAEFAIREILAMKAIPITVEESQQQQQQDEAVRRRFLPKRSQGDAASRPASAQPSRTQQQASGSGSAVRREETNVEAAARQYREQQGV